MAKYKTARMGRSTRSADPREGAVGGSACEAAGEVVPEHRG